MKKLIAALLSVLMLVSFAAVAEETETDRFAASVVGAVMEITEEGSLIVRDEDGMYYEVLINEDTDLLDAESVKAGDIVTAWYNGMLSRSIPAQLTATKVSCFAFTGSVTEITDEGFTLVTADEYAVLVKLPEDMGIALIAEGQQVTVYYDGKMTRSYPGEITALKVRVIDLNGVVAAIDEEGDLIVNTETVGEVIVHISEETAIYGEIVLGASVAIATNGMMTMSLPGQTTAVEIFVQE